MTLNSSLQLDFARLPSMLSDLTALRSLTIHRMGILASIHCTLAILKSLSPTLEKLEMVFKGAHSLLEPNSALQMADRFAQVGADDKKIPAPIESTYIDLAAQFPRLQTLLLDPLFVLRSTRVLPPTLTSLGCRLEIDERTTHLSSLHNSLISRYTPRNGRFLNFFGTRSPCLMNRLKSYHKPSRSST